MVRTAALTGGLACRVPRRRSPRFAAPAACSPWTWLPDGPSAAEGVGAAPEPARSRITVSERTQSISCSRKETVNLALPCERFVPPCRLLRADVAALAGGHVARCSGANCEDWRPGCPARALYEAASALMPRFNGKDKLKSWGKELAKRGSHRKAAVVAARKWRQSCT